jgi:hypothetical protein
LIRNGFLRSTSRLEGHDVRGCRVENLLDQTRETSEGLGLLVRVAVTIVHAPVSAPIPVVPPLMRVILPSSLAMKGFLTRLGCRVREMGCPHGASNGPGGPPFALAVVRFNAC